MPILLWHSFDNCWFSDHYKSIFVVRDFSITVLFHCLVTYIQRTDLVGLGLVYVGCSCIVGWFPTTCISTGYIFLHAHTSAVGLQSQNAKRMRFHQGHIPINPRIGAVALTSDSHNFRPFDSPSILSLTEVARKKKTKRGWRNDSHNSSQKIHKSTKNSKPVRLGTTEMLTPYCFSILLFTTHIRAFTTHTQTFTHKPTQIQYKIYEKQPRLFSRPHPRHIHVTSKMWETAKIAIKKHQQRRLYNRRQSGNQ